MATNLKIETDDRPHLGVAGAGRRDAIAAALLPVGDLAAIALGIGLAVRATAASGPPSALLAEAVTGACLGVLFLLAGGAYRAESRGRAHVRRLLPAVAGLGAYALLVAFVEADGVAPAAWPLAGVASLLAHRLAVHAWWRGVGLGGARPVVVAGDPSLLDEALARLPFAAPRAARPPFAVVARVELVDRGSPAALAADIERLLQPIRQGRAETVLLALPWHEASGGPVVGRLAEHAVDVFLVGGPPGLRDAGRKPGWLGGLPCRQVVRRPVRGWRALVKEGGDRGLALVAIAMLLPLLAAVWLAIRLDSKGPAVYRQKRQGRNGRMFDILKFRTMRIDRCDSGLGTVAQATRHDPRVTRVGRILRRTSLDELPQLLNVLKGEMSLVGPRPHAVAHDEHYGRLVEGYAARRRMKPGITGWAQVHGYRGETDTLEKMKKRIDYDLDYIERWSPALDLRILLRTLAVGFVHANAR
jgi:putative colanic acid biosynthesis UDP-glucose lipid carrier transferase